MTTVVSSYSPVWNFQLPGGGALVGAQIFSYQAGTSIPAPTYTDSTGTQQNTNPILTNARGDSSSAVGTSIGVWIPPGASYKFVLEDASGNILWTVDNYLAPVTAFTSAQGMTQAAIGTAFYPPNSAEQTAGVNVTQPWFYYLDPRRYGATGNGTTDDTGAFNAAFSVAAVSGGTVVIAAAPNFYLITQPLNLTPRTFNAISYNAGYSVQMQPNLHFSQNSPAGSIRAVFAGGHLFDMSGNIGVAFYDLCITSDPTTFPATCFFVARVGAPGNINRWTNCRVFGSFSNSIYYDYGGEDDILVSCYFFNYANLSNTRAITWTANNISGLSSTFQTVATPPRSCLHHHVMGGNFQVVNGTASSDVFYLEQASFVELDQPWVACPGGRSLVFADTTNAPSSNVTILSLQTEAGAAPTYGVNVPNPGAGTPILVSWTIDNSYFDTVTNIIGSGTNISFWQSRFRGLTATSGNINIQGTLKFSTIDCDGVLLNIGTDTQNTLIGNVNNWTIGSTSTSAYITNGPTFQWTPTLNTFTTSAAIKANTTSSRGGALVTVSVVVTPNGGNVICTGGTATITGLPWTPGAVGSCVAVDQTTNVVLGTGYVNATGIFPPTLNSAHNVGITATYTAA